jgi:hypothetical protein
MFLKDCQLGTNFAFVGNLFRDEPEQEWSSVNESGIIPPELYSLYCKAGYLSFDKVPRFLADSEKMLWGYFGILLRALRDFCSESKDQREEFVKWLNLMHERREKNHDKSWHPEAPEKSRRSFKYFMASIIGSLDAFAELIALFFPDKIENLQLGRGESRFLDQWLKRAFVASIIISPSQTQLQKLHDNLNPLWLSVGSASDWVDLAKMYRNKSTHMGDYIFRISLPDDAG